MATSTLSAPPRGGTGTGGAPRARWRRRTTATGVVTYAAAACFVLILFGLIASVVVESFATSWHGGWWPDGLTGWLLLLPVMLPPLTYATQLSSLIYTAGFGGTLTGVIVSNLVPALPFVILVVMPFVEQVRPDVEQAARVLGAGTFQIFLRVVGPLLLPGVLAASILTLVRVFGAFELTFFVSGPGSESLIVAVFGAASNPAGSTPPLLAAMAVCYMGTSLVVFALALAFVNPTQIVSRR